MQVELPYKIIHNINIIGTYIQTYYIDFWFTLKSHLIQDSI